MTGFGCEDAHSRVLVRNLRRLLEELRVAARVIEPSWGRALLSRDTECCQALTTWLRTYSHHGQIGLGGQPPLPVWLTSQVRISPGAPDRCKVVGAEPFSQSGKSFGCTPPNLMSICSRRTF
jgi:hypothetical protein